MSLNIGIPQAILLALYIMSFAVCCVKDGEQSTAHWCDYECHRHAPAMVSSGEGTAMSVWPGISGFDWCGEYEMTD